MSEQGENKVISIEDLLKMMPKTAAPEAEVIEKTEGTSTAFSDTASNLTNTIVSPSIDIKAPEQVCSNCGWLVNQVWEPNIEDNLKISFIDQVIISGNRWTQKYELFNGKLILELRTLTTLEQKISLDLALSMSNPPRLLDIFRYELGFATASINRNGKIEIYDEIDKLGSRKTYEEVYKALLSRLEETVSTWTVPLFGIIQRQYNKFEITHAQLASKATDPDFWKATV